MAEIIVVIDLPADVQAAELVDTMVAAANARASRVAPCLASTDPAPSEDLLAEARLVLIGAVSRWASSGAGALSQWADTAGPFTRSETIDTRQRTGYNLWPSEIADLQGLCADATQGGVYSVSMAGADPDGTWVPPYAGWATAGWRC